MPAMLPNGPEGDIGQTATAAQHTQRRGGSARPIRIWWRVFCNRVCHDFTHLSESSRLVSRRSCIGWNYLNEIPTGSDTEQSERRLAVRR
jgi:hypothetical protein